MAARWRSRELTAFDGLLESAEAAGGCCWPGWAATAPSPRPRLRATPQCPYHFFLEKVIGLRELEEPEEVERIDAPTAGR